MLSDASPVPRRTPMHRLLTLAAAVIAARDYYTQVGLDVTVDYGADNASLITQALIAGDADVGSSGTGALYNAYAQGRTNLVSMGSSNPSITFGLALNQQTVDMLVERGVTPDSPVEERVKALRAPRRSRHSSSRPADPLTLPNSALMVPNCR